MKRLLYFLVVILLLPGCLPAQETQQSLDQFVIETLVAATFNSGSTQRRGT